ncbi:unnamed protein product [Rotaria sp. Silwood1]|nr:unnamed protein product [Rotaria sp. Silwood1]CAF1651878.1 unnamed protein product [Rotaria sp. Silwood1]CAF3837466.1 unnamed protein product [Rotaria sp. Silwood1]CAF3927833.1 unnamed protein product [Rotaria sp. Silwood1]CAF4879968.1 unnamed protein product [Rotaria sp. Silwood1]
MDATKIAASAATTGNVTRGAYVSGGGNNLNNYSSSYNVGIGVPLVSGGSNRPSVGLAGTFNGGFGASNGQNSISKPNYSVGISFQFPF